MIIHKKVIDSTNTYALELANTKKVSFGTMILADEQTSGRGRYKRQWVSEKGNLFCSIVLYSIDCFSDAGKISFAASLAVVETLEHFGAKNIHIKWPNDVIIDNKKISGILIETNGDKQGAIIVGIGVNLKHYPTNIKNYDATSLNEIIKKEINPKEFAIHMRIKLLNLLKQDNLIQLWTNKVANIGKEIKVKLKNHEIEGTFKGINTLGHLELELKTGEKITISAGDVFL